MPIIRSPSPHPVRNQRTRFASQPPELTHSNLALLARLANGWLDQQREKIGLWISIWNQILVISDYGEICNPNWESNRKTWKDGKSDEDLYFLPPSPSQRHSNGVILQLAHLRKQAPPLTKSRGEKADHKMQLWDEKRQQCCSSPGLQTKHTKAPIKWSALSCQHSVAAISKRGFP